MCKKILSVFIAICTLLTMTAGTVFADETTELKAARKALTSREKEIVAYNDITPEEFLINAAKVLPEGSTVELSFKNSDADLRIYRATTEKAGSIIARFNITERICRTCFRRTDSSPEKCYNLCACACIFRRERCI